VKDSLDFFSKTEQVTPKVVVFEYAEREVPDFDNEPADEFKPSKVYSVESVDV
jgi:hypothetical protein